MLPPACFTGLLETVGARLRDASRFGLLLEESRGRSGPLDSSVATGIGVTPTQRLAQLQAWGRASRTRTSETATATSSETPVTPALVSTIAQIKMATAIRMRVRRRLVLCCEPDTL